MTNEENETYKRLPPRSSMKSIVKILYFLGIWHVNDEPRDWLFHLRYLLPRFWLFRTCYSFVFQCINVTLVWGDTENVAVHVTMCILYVIVAIKLSTLFFQRVKIQAMMEDVEDLHQSKYFDSEYMRNVLNRSNLIIEFLMKMTVACVGVVGVFSLTIGPINAHIQGNIPFRLWLPYDASYTPVLEITTFFTNLFTVMDTTIIVANSGSFLTLVAETVAQFRVLRYNLENIRNTAMASMKNSAVQRVSTLGSQLVASSLSTCPEMYTLDVEELDDDFWKSEVNNFLSVTERHEVEAGELESSSPDERARLTASCVVVERDDENVAHEMEKVLRRCILHHLRLLKLVEDNKTVFKSGLDIELFIIACLSFVGLYITTLAGSVDVEVLIMGCFLLGLTYEFLMYCWFADELTEQSALINDAAYACDWLDASEGFKRSIRIIMDKSQKPLFITVAGLPLSRITCKMAFKGAYYLHALLSKLYFGEKLFKKTE